MAFKMLNRNLQAAELQFGTSQIPRCRKLDGCNFANLEYLSALVNCAAFFAALLAPISNRDSRYSVNAPGRLNS